MAQRFPHLAGLHQVGDMQLVVSRGAGGWGPRMRLWRPGEILKLTLRAPDHDGGKDRRARNADNTRANG